MAPASRPSMTCSCQLDATTATRRSWQSNGPGVRCSVAAHRRRLRPRWVVDVAGQPGELVAHPVALGAQVGQVVVVGPRRQRHPLGDRDPVGLQARRAWPGCWSAAGRCRRRGRAGSGRPRRSGARRRAARGRGSRRRCRGRRPAAGRPAAWRAARCRGPRGRAGRAPRRGPPCTISSSASSSCGPQSQRSEPNTSPVRHSECTRTSTGSPPVSSPGRRTPARRARCRRS